MSSNLKAKPLYKRCPMAQADFPAVKADMMTYLEQLPDEYVIHLCNYFASENGFFSKPSKKNPLMKMLEMTSMWKSHKISKGILNATYD